MDRCKPDYAVKVLETLKHFYKNEKITILVVTDNSRLSETVRHFYGYGINGSEYLNRIYDSVISLPMNNIEKYVEYYSNMPKGTWLSKNFSIFLFKFFDFSYRDCNRFFTMYDMCKNYIEYKGSFIEGEYNFESQILVPYAIALKISNLKKYENFANMKGQSDLKEMITYLMNDANSDMYNWICEIIKNSNKDTFETIFIERYLNAFNISGVRRYPFIEAISLFGNKIEI